MTNVPDLFALASAARENAYAPYSHFKVGAALIDDRGRVFSGCNVEAANLKGGNCAEGSVIAAMIQDGGKKVAEILCVGPIDKAPVAPCGNCRQLIREFATDRTRIHMVDSASGDVLRSFTMAELLPESFGPENLQ